MDSEKNTAADSAETQEQVKKPYQTPRLTIHGTVQQITGMTDELAGVQVPGVSGFR
jgi:hypothetical protein